MATVYEQVQEFMKKHPGTLVCKRRLKKHCDIVEKHLNPGEVVNYAFCAQKNAKSSEIFETCVVALTNDRLLIAQKRVLFGYFFNTITPDMYNDLKVHSNLIWGKIIIDTIKEKVFLSNIAIDALDDIETAITSFMMTEKKEYLIENSK